MAQLESLFVQVPLLAHEMKLMKLGRRALDGTKMKAEVSALTAQAEAADQPWGREPEPPLPGPRDTDQVNLTDEELRIMPVSGVGFKPCYNTQTGVDTETMLVVRTHITQAANHTREIMPALSKLCTLPEALAAARDLLADTGSFSQANVQACIRSNIQPSLAVARDQYHQSGFERFASDTAAPDTEDPVTLMKYHLTTQSGRALLALRKQTVEPVFGIIKHVMGLRQFSLRGVDKVSGEWTLADLAWNVKRMNMLRLAV